MRGDTDGILETGRWFPNRSIRTQKKKKNHARSLSPSSSLSDKVPLTSSPCNTGLGIAGMNINMSCTKLRGVPSLLPCLPAWHQDHPPSHFPQESRDSRADVLVTDLQYSTPHAVIRTSMPTTPLSVNTLNFIPCSKWETALSSL